MNVTILNGTNDIGKVFKSCGELRYPQWWMSTEDSVAKQRIHAETLGTEIREILSAHDHEIYRVRRKTAGGVETHVESLSSEYLHCKPVARIVVLQRSRNFDFVAYHA